MPATADAITLAVAAADAADDKKASDLTILDVADLLAVVDLFLLVTTSSDRQLRAVADSIEERLRQDGRRPVRREGEAAGGWVLLDFGDLVCHLFSEEQRDHYGLERLWSDVPRYDPRSGEPLPPGAAASATGSTSEPDERTTARPTPRRIDVVDLT